MTFHEPPLTALPEGPPAPPEIRPVSRQVVHDLLTDLGYDPAWVNVVTISPAGVRVSFVSGEVYPIVIERDHPFAEPEPVPEPGPRR
jgi:hypothetical protein